MMTLVGKRQGAAALMLVMGAILAFGSLAIGVRGASAHHNEYDAKRLCDGSWTAIGLYVGGENERLVIISNVVINGVPFDPSWSGGLFVPYDPAVHGATTSPVGSPAFAWKGTSPGFTIFDRSGTNFVGGPANWSGTLHIFGPDQDKAGMWSMTREPVHVFEPAGPTDCAPTNTPTTPPCYEPGTTPPAGAPACTPTPVPPTSTPTTPPCYPPGTTNPPSGAAPCTPTPSTPPCYPPGTSNPPSGAAPCTPTPVNTVAGARTPGPTAPSAGMGLGGDISSTNVLFALLGLLALSGGAALMALGRAPAED